MRGKRCILLIVSVLSMFVFQGELAAQGWNLTITPEGKKIKVGSTLNLTATASWTDWWGIVHPFQNIPVTFSLIQGNGSVLPLVDTTNANGEAYTVFTAGNVAGANKVVGCYGYHLRCPYTCDTVDIEVITCSCICRFDLVVVSPDTLTVGEYAEIEITAKDKYGNTVIGYSGSVTLSLTGSTADPSQVSWIVLGDTLTGLSVVVPDSSFVNGVLTVYVSSKKAETVGVKADDGKGHKGTTSKEAITVSDVTTADGELNVVTISERKIVFEADTVDGFVVKLLSSREDTINTSDTTDIKVTAVDSFGNSTIKGLPVVVGLSVNKTGVIFLNGDTLSLVDSVTLFPMVAQEVCSGLIITVTDTADISIYGNSNPIEVIDGKGGVEEVPAVSNIIAKFGSGEILYSVAKEGIVEIKVFDKAGRAVGILVNGVVKSGYYQTSLKGLNLSSDIYFIVMKGTGFTKSVKAPLIVK